jgi:hypothetical protein
MTYHYVARIVGVERSNGFDVIVNSDGEAAYATPCCGATAKGCDGYTGCRACYRPIDPALGDLPPAVWWAPHQRHRVESFNAFLLEMIANASAGR